MGDRIALLSESAYTSSFRPNLKRIRLRKFPQGIILRASPSSFEPCIHVAGKNIFHHLIQFRLKSLEGIGGLETLAPSRAHFTSARGIGEERFEGVRKKRGVTMRHEHAAHAVLDHIR